jgi:uncharacterized DUF497 family protein
VEVCFAWDSAKAASNLLKHGVSFEVARLVFSDPFALSAPERVEGGEERWQTIGSVRGSMLLGVAHTVQDEADTQVIRIISARRAEARERRRYEQEVR